MAARCPHNLVPEYCAACNGVPRDKLGEAIEERTTTCQAQRCGAEIVMARTEASAGRRAMPVDVEPHPEGAVELFLFEGRELWARVLPKPKRDQGALPIGDLELRQSHFVTCSEPDRFRRT